MLTVAQPKAPSSLSRATLKALWMCVGIALSACHQPAQSSSAAETVTDVSQGGPRRVEEIHRGVQTVCRVDGKEFPPSFLVSDLGKPGVPKLDADELQQVRSISRYVHSPTLRFQEVAGQFLIYDASLGPCMLAAPGYWVLNADSCNMYFMPADEWSGPGAFYRCGNPPRPWVPHDEGDPNKSWSGFPPAGIFTQPPHSPQAPPRNSGRPQR